MYLHLGADCMIKNTDIIAIFNIRDQQSEIYDNYISVNKRINIKLLIYRKMVSVQAVF